MKRMFISIIFTILSISTFANNFKIPKEGKRIEDFYYGYNLLQVEVGDLNKDGLDDVVLLIEEPGRIPEPGIVDYEAEPSKILVLFKKKNGGYRLVSKNEKLIMKEGLSYEPLIEIKKGVLYVREAITPISNIFEEYVFRFQKGHMELIGYEETVVNRVSEYSEKISINLSTNRMSITKGGAGNEKTEWKKIDVRSVYFLENMTDETGYEILKEAKYDRWNRIWNIERN